MIYDVRSHGYYDRKATRVKGSTRLEPNALGQFEQEFPPASTFTCTAPAWTMRPARAWLSTCWGKASPPR